MQTLAHTSHHSPSVPPAASTTTPNDTIPTLTYEIVKADDQDARIAALKLIADSVAQQRQTASRAIIFHPAIVATVVLLLALGTYYCEWTTLITTGMGVVMAGLLLVRLTTSPYISLAEEINFGWLSGANRDGGEGYGNGGGGSGGLSDPSKDRGTVGTKENPVHKRNGSDGNKNTDPIILVSKWGEEIMGALILRFVKKERKGYVRAYTVRLRYRKRGVGQGLLEEAARIVWSKGGRAVEFDENHASE